MHGVLRTRCGVSDAGHEHAPEPTCDHDRRAASHGVPPPMVSAHPPPDRERGGPLGDAICRHREVATMLDQPCFGSRRTTRPEGTSDVGRTRPVDVTPPCARPFPPSSALRRLLPAEGARYRTAVPATLDHLV